MNLPYDVVKQNILILVLVVLYTVITGVAQGATPFSNPPRSWDDLTSWGDQGNGTYRNPVLPVYP